MLKDGLAIYLEEEFSVTLEDQSERQVVETLFRMYEECFRGDFSFTRHMIAHAMKAVEFSAQHQPPVQTTEHDDDDDDTDMVGTDKQEAIQTFDIANATSLLEMPLFGEARKPSAPTGPVRQLGEAIQEEPNDVDMDDDGFAPVKTKGRRRG